MLFRRAITLRAALAGVIACTLVGCQLQTANVGETGAGAGGDTGLGGRQTGGSVAAGGRASDRAGGGGAPTAGSSSAGGARIVVAGGALGRGGEAGVSDQPCDCPKEGLSWGETGGLGRGVLGTLDCQGFSRRSDDTPSSYSCELPNTHCYPNWQSQLQQVFAALQLSDVKAALAASPTLYGRDARFIDIPVFTIHYGDKLVEIGEPCEGSTTCVAPPPGVATLVEALKRLERHAALDCSPECQPTPAAPLGEECGEDRFYWMHGACVQVPGRRCADGFATEAECKDGRWQCSYLYPKSCAAGAVSQCDDDEYCNYQQSFDCGLAAGAATCLPKPVTCATTAAMVCGCDSQTYLNSCIAARAGVGTFTMQSCVPL
ncbi:MAG: hypothetical protein QM756_35175 [Polyangiaceae bacterium]